MTSCAVGVAPLHIGAVLEHVHNRVAIVVVRGVVVATVAVKQDQIVALAAGAIAGARNIQAVTTAVASTTLATDCAIHHFKTFVARD